MIDLCVLHLPLLVAQSGTARTILGWLLVLLCLLLGMLVVLRPTSRREPTAAELERANRKKR
jgi:hypothetical protein